MPISVVLVIQANDSKHKNIVQVQGMAFVYDPSFTVALVGLILICLDPFTEIKSLLLKKKKEKDVRNVKKKEAQGYWQM